MNRGKALGALSQVLILCAFVEGRGFPKGFFLVGKPLAQREHAFKALRAVFERRRTSAPIPQEVAQLSLAVT